MDQQLHGAQVPLRRRNRRINTCLECQRLKRKCSRTHPCTHCLKTIRECIFPTTSSNPTTPPIGQQPAVHTDPTPSLSHQDQEALAQRDASGFLKQAHTVANTSTQAERLQSPDLCLQIGRLSITDRIGGVKRGYLVS